MIVFYVKLYSAVISQQSVVSSHYLLVTSHVSLATSRISLSTVQQIRYITNLLQNERIVLESAMSSWNCWENPSKCLPRFSKQKYPINMWFWNCIIQKRMHGLVGQGTRHKTQSEKRKAKIRTWILLVHLCEYAQIRYTVKGTHGQLRNTMGASETSITGTPRFFFWMVKIKSELNWFF